MRHRFHSSFACVSHAFVFTLSLVLVSLPVAAKKGHSTSEDDAVELPVKANRVMGLSATFEGFAAQVWVARSVALPDVGLNSAVVMGGAETLRDIYLPVPANVPLQDASVQFNASYMRADPGRTTLLLALDKVPVLAKGITLERGDASAVVAVPNTVEPSGFVRLGIQWNTVISMGANDSICNDNRSMGNLLRIEPTSRLSYRFDASAVRDLTTAWSAMPQAPVILVSSKQLAPDAYESAWRIGLTLERAGKRSNVLALPAVGQEVDVSRLVVPEALRQIPAFAAFATGPRHTLKDVAEVGAWFALNQISAQHADVVVADRNLTNSIATGLDALLSQIKAQAPEAAAGFAQWRQQRLDTVLMPIGAGELRLTLSSGGTTVVVAPDAGRKLVEVFDTQWRNVAASTSMVVKSANLPSEEANAVSLTALGGAPNSFDVQGYGEWLTKFEIGAGVLKGHRPSELVMDLSAAPSSWGTVPVASVFLNEVLLVSKQMDANGKRERLTAIIPSYALGARNVIRVSFVRQLLSDRCRENPGAFPVSVLPSSHVVLGGKSSDDDFPGLSARLAQSSEVLVPTAYLADAPRSLARLIRVSAASDISPGNGKFAVVTGDQAKPSAPFLALDLGFAEQKRKVTVEAGHLMVVDDKEHKLLDVSGLTRVGIASVERVDGQPGIFYYTVAEDMGRYDKPYQLMHGNFAVVGQDGLTSQFDTRNGTDRRLFDEVKEPWFKRYFWWLIPMVAITLFLVLLYAASRFRRRKAD